MHISIVAVVVMFSGSGSSKQTPEPIQLSNDLVGEATGRSLNLAILATQLIKEEPLFRDISEKKINQIVDFMDKEMITIERKYPAYVNSRDNTIFIPDLKKMTKELEEKLQARFSGLNQLQIQTIMHILAYDRACCGMGLGHFQGFAVHPSGSEVLHCPFPACAN